MTNPIASPKKKLKTPNPFGAKTSLKLDFILVLIITLSLEPTHQATLDFF
jgi:hypothetical protein